MIKSSVSSFLTGTIVPSSLDILFFNPHCKNDHNIKQKKLTKKLLNQIKGQNKLTHNVLRSKKLCHLNTKLVFVCQKKYKLFNNSNKHQTYFDRAILVLLFVKHILSCIWLLMLTVIENFCFKLEHRTKFLNQNT